MSMPAREYKLALQQFQSARLRRDHADLAAERQYQAIGEFFFNEMYGPRDFAARDDQARVSTARDAIRAGADLLVVGRPIRDAADPVAAARALVAEIESANS